MKYLYGKRIKTLKDRVTTLVASLAILANSAGMALPFMLTQRVAANTHPSFNIEVTSHLYQGLDFNITNAVDANNAPLNGSYSASVRVAHGGGASTQSATLTFSNGQSTGYPNYMTVGQQCSEATVTVTLFNVSGNDISETATTYTCAGDVPVPDTTAPTIEVLAPEADSTHDENISVSIRATDDGSGLDFLHVNAEDPSGAVFGCRSSNDLGGAKSKTVSCTINISNRDDGTYRLRLRAGDVAGNTAGTMFHYFTVNRGAPVFAFTSPEDGFVTNSDFEVQFEAMKDGMGVGQVVVNVHDLSLEGSTHVQACYNKDANGEEHYTSGCTVDISGLADGEYQLRGNARSPHNSLSNTASQTFVVDTTPPVVTVTPVAGSLLSGTVTFEITVEDDNLSPDTDRVWVYLYNTAPPQTTRGGHVDLSSGSATFTVDTTQLADGGASFAVSRLFDAAGNPSGTGDTYFRNYVIDNTAPSANFLDPTPEDGAYVNGDFEVKFKATDNHKVKLVNAALYGDGWTWITGCYDNDSLDVDEVEHTCTIELPSGLEDGAYTLKLNSRDHAGNWGWGDDTRTITVDRTDATTQILAPVVDEPISGTYRFHGIAEDNLSGVDQVIVRIGTQVGNTGAFTGYANFNPDTGKWFLDVDTKNIPDGIYNVRARAVDNAGNNGNSGMHVLRDFTIDNTQPVIEFITPVANSTVSGLVTIQARIIEEGSGLDYVWVKFVDGTDPNQFGAVQMHLVAGETDIYEAQIDTTPYNGVYALGIDVADNAGNGRSAKAQDITVDNPQPSVLGENFNTHDGADYKGINVGFRISDFQTVTGVTVDLYHDGDSTPFVSNTHNDELLALIGSGTTQLSTPFITTPGTYIEQYWNLGTYLWSPTSLMPIKAVVTVTGTNSAGQSATESVEISPLDEGSSSWPTFASVLPAAIQNNTGGNGGGIGTGGLNNPAPQATGGPTVAGVSTGTPNRVAVLDNNADSTSDDSEENTDDDARVLQATDTANGSEAANETDSEDANSCGKILGICWYWWIPVVIVILGTIYYISSRRADEK